MKGHSASCLCSSQKQCFTGMVKLSLGTGTRLGTLGGKTRSACGSIISDAWSLEHKCSKSLRAGGGGTNTPCNNKASSNLSGRDTTRKKICRNRTKNHAGFFPWALTDTHRPVARRCTLCSSGPGRLRHSEESDICRVLKSART